MKDQRIRVSEDKREDLLEEFITQGYHAAIVGEDVVVYGERPKPKPKKPTEPVKVERWSKRERNFGWTRR